MHEAGVAPIEIAARVHLRASRVRSFLTNVRKGSVRVPAAPVGALVPVAPAGGAVALRARQYPVAQDAEMRTARMEEMADAEREKAVARSIYPEMRP